MEQSEIAQSIDLNSGSFGLALGGGAVLGAAHIGVLRALEEIDARPDFISGTSIGAMVAALYAFGISVDRIEQIAKNMSWLTITSLSISRYGLFSNDELGRIIRSEIGEHDIQEADIPLAIMASDIAKGKKVTFTEGPLDIAVQASTCIPGIFIPIEHNDQMLVDGGITENVPVSVLREFQASPIVGVDLSAHRSYERPDDIIDVLINAIDLAIDRPTPAHQQVDSWISPHLASYDRTDTERVSEIVEVGYKTTKEWLGRGEIAYESIGN
ncbi:MAG: patatin-like phospholipase family protein [Bacteroidota bacterium]